MISTQITEITLIKHPYAWRFRMQRQVVLFQNLLIAFYDAIFNTLLFAEI